MTLRANRLVNVCIPRPHGSRINSGGLLSRRSLAAVRRSDPSEPLGAGLVLRRQLPRFFCERDFFIVEVIKVVVDENINTVDINHYES